MNNQNNNNVPNNHALRVDSLDHHQMMVFDGSRGSRGEEDDVGINLRDLWQVIVRRKATVFVLLILTLIAATIGTYLQTPIYRSTVTLQINPKEMKVVNYEVETGGRAESGGDFIATQLQLLKSRTLARRVIDQLALDKNPAFIGVKKKSFFKDSIDSLKSLISGTQPELKVNDQLPKWKPNYEGRFLRGLTVSPVRGSRLVKVSYESPNAKLAKDVVNAIAKVFINTNLERRFESSSYAKTFLAERIKQVRANLEDAELRLVEYARERDIIDVESKHGLLMSRINALIGRISEVEGKRIQAESAYEVMQLGTNHGYSEVLDSPVIQQQKAVLAKLESNYQEQLSIFKPSYPSMLQLQKQIDSVKENIVQEVENVRSGVQGKFQEAVKEEARLRAKMSSLRAEVLSLQDRSTDYSALKRDVESSLQVYNSLLQRIKEVGVAAEVGTNNISVVDKGELARGPFTPNLKKNLSIALLIGLFGGIGLAFLFEHLDDSIKSGEDLEKLMGIALLGMIPEVDKSREDVDKIVFMAYDKPKSAISEAYRSVRTALTFSTASGAPGVIHITSSMAGEGKTTTSISLSSTFVQAGAKVLLIDADLRNPSLHKELMLSNEIGLTNYLAGELQPSKIIQKTKIPNLFVVPSGPLPPNPAELLSSGKMLDLLNKLQEKFDQVIVDGPPVLGLADSLVLANMIKATVLVVDAGATRTGAVEGTIKRLRSAQAVLLGGVLCKYGQSGSGGYGYDYSYNYYNYQNESDADDYVPEKITQTS